MPFRPLRLLIFYDDARGYCGRVVPTMKTLLEQRAFLVDTHRVGDGPIDVSPYKGFIFGSPCFGLGIRGVGPTPALAEAVAGLGDLEGRKAAVYCVHEVRPGTTLDRMKGMIFEQGMELVAAHAFWVLKPHEGEHILPTECMVRVR